MDDLATRIRVALDALDSAAPPKSDGATYSDGLGDGTRLATGHVRGVLNTAADEEWTAVEVLRDLRPAWDCHAVRDCVDQLGPCYCSADWIARRNAGRAAIGLPTIVRPGNAP